MKNLPLTRASFAVRFPPRFHIQEREPGGEWKTIASFHSEGVARFALLIPPDNLGTETRLMFDDHEIKIL